MGQQFVLFILRWILNTFALWIAVRLLGNIGASVESSQTLMGFLLAGLVLSVINVLLRPIVVILSLPAILLTLGLFTLVVNGFMVYVTTKLVPGFDMSFGAAILAGIIVSLVNYVLSGLLQLKQEKRASVK